MIGISGSMIWSKTLMELIFDPCSEFRWSPEGPVSHIHSSHLVGAPGIFSDLSWPQSKTATLVFEFTVEDLPSGQKCNLGSSVCRNCPCAVDPTL